MAEIIFIVGLPASGKTTLALNKYVPKGYRLIDDPIHFDENTLRFDLRKRQGGIQIKHGFDYVICDAGLCPKEAREYVKKIFYRWKQTWIFFENDVDKCMKNNQGRDRTLIIRYINTIYQRT